MILTGEHTILGGKPVPVAPGPPQTAHPKTKYIHKFYGEKIE
jgi:hypothetical protein